jgi:nucleolar protein 56
VTRAIVTTWYGCFLTEGGTVLRQLPTPRAVEDLCDRARLRAGGRTTPEEEALLRERGTESWVTRDRRLVGPGVSYAVDAPATVAGESDAPLQREFLLRAAEEALEASWDPSIHVEEAVRAVRDLDRAGNLIGERIASWVGRDTPDVDASDPAKAARAALEPPVDPLLGPDDPRLREARQRLAELYGAIGATRDALEAAVAASVPVHTPNLHALLGPELTGLMLAQAGGLDRLARLPASTVQVLGAERAFFEHLRGRAPPPRHGLLFMHPQVQSAPRNDRGKLARALAGKVAIAARRDQAGSPNAPELKAAFERRESDLRARRSAGRRKGRAPGSALPLDRAARDR